MKVGLPPVAQPDARLFILGSLPGDASLAAQRYYAHPTNQFWRLLGAAIGEDLQSLAYEARLQLLGERQIGLWDVIASAERPGSLDQAIRRAEHNQLEALLKAYPGTKAIAFNGSAAAKIGGRLLTRISSPPHVIALPSSSAANTLKFHEKAREWSQIAGWAGAKSLRNA
jgi:double-stranded uracil-DNA glycosylase